jgi:hypothetical protein
MRATALEQETDKQTPVRAAETQREDGTSAIAQLAGTPEGLTGPQPGLLNARMLLGLQATAGNAAVAGLIEKTRESSAYAPAAPARPRPKPAESPAPPRRQTGAAPEARTPETSRSEPAPETLTSGTAPATLTSGSALEPPTSGPAPEAPTSGPAPEALTSGTTPEAGGEASTPSPAGASDDELAPLDAAAEAVDEAPGDRESVAQDAQAELAELSSSHTTDAETSGGPTEAGTAIEERPAPEVPDLSAMEPASGLARVAGLPPAQLLSSLGGVSGAVALQTSQEHARLGANPPQRPRHPGAPSIRETPVSARRTTAEPAPASSIARVPAGPDIRVPQPASQGADGTMGPLPRLPLEGSADPTMVQQQRRHVLAAVEGEHALGQQEAAHPMGEDEIFPNVPAETLRAAVGGTPGSNGHAPAPAAAEDDEAVSIMAQQEKGSEIQGAVSGGLAGLAAPRREYSKRTVDERAKADTEMAQLEHGNVEQQAGERAAAKREVLGLRGQWTDAQREVVAGAQGEADAKTSETLQTVARERGTAEQQAAAHYQEGQQQANQARREGEQQAAAERQKAQQQGPGGLLGAVASAAQSLFDQAKRAVQSVIDRVRQVVNAAIDRTVQLAMSVMERARQAIVGAIREAGSFLLAVGDRVLDALAAVRSRFRRLIQDRIAAAEAVVNKLANGLKQAIQTSLNLLGATLSAAIGLWQRGMQAVIDGIRAVVQGALQFARGAIAALGTFAVLVKDIAAGPMRWVANLAAAARDGIRNHLWPALKFAVQGWFNEKVDSVLGLGSAVWSLLKRGGITVAQVGRFAWDAIKSMIPQAVIWILIEKLVSLLVPAAAAVMLIIQALQAAWGSLGRILQAFDAFIAFLKGVRWGNAGPLFGGALAAAAVAVIEFISQFLLQRLMGATATVAGKVRALAKRIGARLAALGQGFVKGVKAGWTGAGRLIRASGRGVAKAQAKLGDSWFMLKNRGLAQKGMAWIDSNGDRCVRHGPMNLGPLKGHFESSFRSSTYTSRRLGQAKDLYRVYSDPVRRLGAFWTDVPPSGPLQSAIDAALHSSYGNAATNVVHIRVPAGQLVHEGLAARQAGWLGGGSQFVLPKVLKEWEVI